jgi:hypothetical protein
MQPSLVIVTAVWSHTELQAAPHGIRRGSVDPGLLLTTFDPQLETNAMLLAPSLDVLMSSEALLLPDASLNDHSGEEKPTAGSVGNKIVMISVTPVAPTPDKEPWREKRRFGEVMGMPEAAVASRAYTPPPTLTPAPETLATQSSCAMPVSLELPAVNR